eukprot:15246-Prorocentrum_minimum.AAC.1
MDTSPKSIYPSCPSTLSRFPPCGSACITPVSSSCERDFTPQEGAQEGAQEGVQEGRYRSGVDAREPQNRDDKVKSTRGIFKVCCRVHEGHKRPKH